MRFRSVARARTELYNPVPLQSRTKKQADHAASGCPSCAAQCFSALLAASLTNTLPHPVFALCTDPQPRVRSQRTTRPSRSGHAGRPVFACAPRRGRGTCPRLAARASPTRDPGLCARAGLFELLSRAPEAPAPGPLSSSQSRRSGPVGHDALPRDLRAARRARARLGPLRRRPTRTYVQSTKGDGAEISSSAPALFKSLQVKLFTSLTFTQT